MTLPDTHTKVNTAAAEDARTVWWRSAVDMRLALVLALFLAVALPSLNDSTLYTPDSPRYLQWARSLASFAGYEDASGPQPFRYVIHAPLYPILLAPVAWLFQNIVVPAKVLTVFAGAALLAAFFVWMKRREGGWAALIGSLFLAINPLIVLFSSHILSDIPFALCVVLFFLVMERTVDQSAHEEWPMQLVAILTAGMFLREIGLTLLMSAGALLLLRKEYRRLLLTLAIPIAFYLIWYYRNEILVGTVENPPLRNTRIFLGHMFTGDDASLLDEFLARLRVNGSVYLNMAKGLMLFPQYLVQPFGVVVPIESVMAATGKVLRYAQIPLAALQYGLVIWGVIASRAKGGRLGLMGLFAFFYVGMIVLYPISDVRFLVPLMILLLLFAVTGGADLVRRLAARTSRRRFLYGVVAALLAVAAIPNAVWLANYFSASRQYRADVADPSKTYLAGPGTPEVYARPASLLGGWIAEHSDSSSTVMGRWKELTFWLQGRKIVDADPLISLTMFEQLLRDHHVGYLVSAISYPGIREFEFQMSLSKRYEFETVYRAGNCEVVAVRRRGSPKGTLSVSESGSSAQDSARAGEFNARARFQEGVRDLEAGRYEAAISAFNVLLQESRGSGYVGLFHGIAYEFGGMYDEALRLFDGFRYRPQAGPFVIHARYHAGLISDLKEAALDSLPGRKSRTYFRISAGYWDLGFHLQAMRLLNQSLSADSTLAPALVFGIHYSLQLGDTAGAQKFFNRVRRQYPDHRIIPTVRTLLATMDSLRQTSVPSVRRAFRLRIAESYLQLGLNDVAIDEAMAVAEGDPSDPGALRILARAYEATDRVWLAVRILERLLGVSPEDNAARQKLEQLKSRLG